MHWHIALWVLGLYWLFVQWVFIENWFDTVCFHTDGDKKWISLFFHRVKVGMYAGTCVNWLSLNSLVFITVVTRLWWFFFGDRYILKSSLVLLPLEPGIIQSYVSILRCENKFWKLMCVKTVNRLLTKRVRLNIYLLLPLLIMHKSQVSCTLFPIST